MTVLLVALFHLAAAKTIPHQQLSEGEYEDFLREPHYHSEEELERLFADLMKEYPGKVEVLSAGKSTEGRELYVLHLNTNVRKRGLLMPMVKYVANMHGDETIGRELLIYLAEYLLHNYGRVEEVTRLLNTTDIYLMPTMNPDGYARSQVCFNVAWAKMSSWATTVPMRRMQIMRRRLFVRTVVIIRQLGTYQAAYAGYSDYHDYLL